MANSFYKLKIYRVLSFFLLLFKARIETRKKLNMWVSRSTRSWNTLWLVSLILFLTAKATLYLVIYCKINNKKEKRVVCIAFFFSISMMLMFLFYLNSRSSSQRMYQVWVCLVRQASQLTFWSKKPTVYLN